MHPVPTDTLEQKTGRIKSLDGVRAVAVSLVLYSHAVNHPGVVVPLIHGTKFDLLLRNLSRSGVILFFVLSGYLITTLLANEKTRSGRIRLSVFFYRRAFRILPVVLLLLGVIGLLGHRRLLDVRPAAFAFAATFTWNYQFLFHSPPLGSDSSVLGHLWSLSVEEQFYVLFPPLMLLCRLRTCFYACLALVLATPLIRLGQYAVFPSSRESGPVMGHTLFGATIAMGCLWALAENLSMGRVARTFLSGRPVFYLAASLGLVVNPLMDIAYGGKWNLPIGDSLAGFCALIMIAHVIRFADTSVVGKFLNLRPVAWFGTISYGIYLWQQPVYHLDLSMPSPLVSRILLTIGAILAATASYYLVESPMLRLRDRLQSRGSARNSDFRP